MSTDRWFIYDGTQPQDGEFFTDKASLFKALAYATDIDVAVLHFDHSDLRANATCQLRDVSEDIATEYWEARGADEAWARVMEGATVCGLLARYFPDEVNAMLRRVA